MSKGKLMLFGAAWSVLILIVLMAVEPVARSGSVIFALVILVGGWLMAASFAGGGRFKPTCCAGGERRAFGDHA